jgi:NADH dehydrogenase
VIGDTAHCDDGQGRPLPGVAPVAKQQGAYAARAIRAAMKGRPIAPFRYRNFGNLATIGRSHAVVDFGRWSMAGLPAWVLWSTVHVWFLSNYRNRLLVGLNLAWNYLTFARHARLITGEGTSHPLSTVSSA